MHGLLAIASCDRYPANEDAVLDAVLKGHCGFFALRQMVLRALEVSKVLGAGSGVGKVLCRKRQGAACCMSVSVCEHSRDGVHGGERCAVPILLQAQEPQMRSLASQFGQGSGAAWWQAEGLRWGEVSLATLRPACMH